MSNFDFTEADSFQAAMKNGVAEAANAFSRTFDGVKISITLGAVGVFDPASIPDAYKSPGLLLLSCFEGKAAAILMPKSTGLVPAWCDAPDASGQSRLTTLAQEWGMSFFPDDFFPDEFYAGVVPNLADAVVAGKPGHQPGFITLKMENASGETVNALFVWSLENPLSALSATKESSSESTSELEAALGPRGRQTGQDGFVPFGAQELYSSDMRHVTLDDLPGFSKSLLKVKIPVAAVLARGKRPIKMILELGVGSVVQFDKSFDAFLDLQVGQMTVGIGEAVKVGDKFGLRIQNIQLPKERFRTIEVRKEGEFKRKKRSSAIIGKAPIRSVEGK
ncbi:MAG: FliM/FliN family flagellar motor switch protein [Planctomycetaceae bacterium]|nr:FliM/FliN family flagellar motor switch protein [Planctomycetaceae bacterium]